MINFAKPVQVFLISILGGYSSSLWAQNLIPAEGATKLHIRGFIGNVVLKAESQPSYRFQFQKRGGVPEAFLEPKWRREGTELVIEIGVSGNTNDYNQVLKSKSNPFVLEIAGPSLPLSLSWRQGDIKITGWRHALQLASTQSQVTLENTAGDMTLQLLAGQLTSKNHEGRLQVMGQSPSIFISKLKGKLELSNISGASTIENAEGDQEIFTSTGATKLKDSSGRLQAQLGRGPLVLEGYSGSVRGKSLQGNVALGLKALNPEIDFTGGSGYVSVSLPAGWGARVDLKTQQGDVSGPNTLQRGSDDDSRKLFGKIGAGEGRIRIKTDSGAIRIK